MHAKGPVQSWYLDTSNRLVLVEDILSAIRVQQLGLSACALLGTHLNNDKVREISLFKPGEVIIALDEDATDEAFKLAGRWGLAFPKIRVAILERDFKDDTDQNILRTLGV